MNEFRWRWIGSILLRKKNDTKVKRRLFMFWIWCNWKILAHVRNMELYGSCLYPSRLTRAVAVICWIIWEGVGGGGKDSQYRSWYQALEAWASGLEFYYPFLALW